MKRAREINPSLLDKKLIGMMPKNKPSYKKMVFDVKPENRTLLDMAERYHSDMRQVLVRRQRVRNYIRGHQWKDMIKDPSGTGYITEEQYIKDQGKVPLKQNLMRNLMKNISGQWQQNPSKSNIMATKRPDAKVGEMLTNTLYYAHQINDTDYLNARNFDEFLMSGFPVAKVMFQYVPEIERPDVYITNIDLRRFIINTDVSDKRLNDVYFVCEIIDAPIEKIVSKFARTKQHEELIKEIYQSADTLRQNSLQGLSPDADDALDFYVPFEPGKVRLYEIWYQENEWGLLIHDPLDSENGYRFEKDGKKEDIEQENTERMLVGIANGIDPEDIALIEAEDHNSMVWKFKFLTPQGYCLLEGDSPYDHGEHPYAFHAYPMIDGESWGPLEDVIDQQRNTNRYMTMLDFMLSASAKGVWLIPEDSKPDDVTKQEYVDELTKIGGAVWYKTTPTSRERPEQKFANAVPAGIMEMLNIQMRLMQEVSGVFPSLQGMPAKSGTPASLYAQEAVNSATNLTDLINAYNMYIKKLDTKVVKTIIQFYSEKRMLHIAGTDYEQEAMEFDPDLVDGFNFDLNVVPGLNSPVFRQMADKMLYDLLSVQAISIEQFLENTSLPFADKLLDSIRQQQQDLMQGQPLTPPPQELVDQINQGSDPRAMEMINRSFQ